MLKTLTILDDTGDSQVSFVAGSGSEEENMARDAFRLALLNGRMVYRKTGPFGKGEQVKKFDDLGPENMACVQLQAG